MSVRYLFKGILAIWMLCCGSAAAQGIYGTNGSSAGGAAPANVTSASPSLSVFEAPGTGSFQISDGVPVRYKTGAYRIQPTDGGTILSFSSASNVAAPIAAAGTTGFTHDFSVEIQDTGAGTVTFTPDSGLVNGGSSLAVPTGMGCRFSADSAGNYAVSECTALISFSSGFPITLGSTSVSASSTTTSISGLTLSGPTFSGTIAGTPTVSGLWTFGSGGRITQSGTTASGAWTTTGIGLIQSATFNDVSSGSGTVAEVDINVLGPTQTFNNTVTVTNEIGSHFKDPVAGTGATFTNKWALEGDSFRAGTSNFFTISNGGVPSSNGTAGVTCSGSPTASFASTNGIVTHC